jgi:hypothetical protein
MRCVLHQAPTVMLCLLDRVTQRSLRFLFPSLVIARRLNTARELYDAHWMNEPFYHSMLRVERSTYWRRHTDLRLCVVQDDVAEMTKSHFSDFPSSVRVSCWEASPRGLSLALYCWYHPLPGVLECAVKTWSGRPICIDIKLLADCARRIVARSYNEEERGSRCRSVDLVGARSEINRFDPDLWHEDAQRSERFGNKNSESWVTMIVAYSRAREIVALAPLLELAPDYMYE